MTITRAMSIGLAVWLSAALTFGGGAWADGGKAPDSLPGTTLVDAEWVKGAMDRGEPLMVIDARIPSEYSQGHLPGAVNIFDGDFDKSHHLLPKEKDHALLFYCNGPKCLKSYDSAKRAVEMGFSHVYWFRNGIPEWTKRGYPLE